MSSRELTEWGLFYGIKADEQERRGRGADDEEITEQDAAAMARELAGDDDEEPEDE